MLLGTNHEKHQMLFHMFMRVTERLVNFEQILNGRQSLLYLCILHGRAAVDDVAGGALYAGKLNSPTI
jgi:hypothetical protein